MRTVSRLRLLFFSFDIYSDVLSTLLLFALSKLCRPGIKTQYQSKFTRNTKVNLLCFYGGPGGIRTPVQNTFLFASYSNNLQYIFILVVCQPLVLRLHVATICLFWARNSSRF